MRKLACPDGDRSRHVLQHLLDQDCLHWRPVTSGRGGWICALAAIVVLGLGLTPSAVAAPGDLDPSFGTGGRQAINFGTGFSSASDIVRQPDGKLVAVGWDPLGFGVARFNPNGSLDTSFSGDGLQSTNFVVDFDSAEGVALQPDGKIVAVGASEGTFAVARYNADGSLDPTFSGDGKLTTNVGAFGRAYSVVVQADGKIIVGGSSFVVVRYLENGDLDTSFSGDGKVKVEGLSWVNDEQARLAVQPDGKVLLAGGTNGEFGVARLLSNGELDPTFSGDGVQRTGFGGDAEAFDIALNGTKVVLAGSSGGDLAVARYSADGTLDPSFSGDGKLTTDLGAFDAARAVEVALDGRITLAGRSGPNVAFARVLGDGGLDTSFSGDGKLVTDAAGDGGQANASLAVGDTLTVAGSGSRGFLIGRVLPDGTEDPAFGTAGWQVARFPGEDYALDIALQSTGKAIAGGDDGDSSFGLMRLDTNGTLDTTFGDQGKRSTEFSGRSFVSALSVQTDDKIVAVGGGEGNGPVVVRYTPDGALDTTFSGDGKVGFDFPGGVGYANAVKAIPGGKIVVGGNVTVDSTTGAQDFAIARLNTDGSLDSSFSGDGITTIDFGDRDDLFSELAVQPDGKIIAVGMNTGTYEFQVARVTSGGALDSTFDTDGKVTTSFGDIDGADTVALAPDQKIIVAGSADGNFAIARYSDNGSLDTTFSGDGKTTVPLPGSEGYATDVFLQADGKLLAVGISDSGFAVARLSTSGLPDPSFSADGVSTSDFVSGDTTRFAAQAALRSDQRLLVAGGSTDFEFAQFDTDGSHSGPGDSTPPQISITAPTEGQRFTQGVTVPTQFSCSDPGGSGVRSCTGAATLDTAAPGAKALKVSAVDNAGNTASKTVNYIVDPQPTDPPGPGPSIDPPMVSPPTLVPLPITSQDGNTPITATDSLIRSALRSVLSPTGKRARIPALLKSGYAFSFNAPASGKLQITWFYLPKGAKLAARAKPIPFATATSTINGAGQAKVRVKLNAAGKKKLKKAKGLKLTTKATFTPTGRAPISSTKSFTVKR